VLTQRAEINPCNTGRVVMTSLEELRFFAPGGASPYSEESPAPPEKGQDEEEERQGDEEEEDEDEEDEEEDEEEEIESKPGMAVTRVGSF
jgi:cobalamin biosynthesis protein CobT